MGFRCVGVIGVDGGRRTEEVKSGGGGVMGKGLAAHPTQQVVSTPVSEWVNRCGMCLAIRSAL
jgi:hypothetical protein